MTISRHFMRVDGRHVYYRRTGSGPPLILLHPAMAHGGFFESMMTRWADRFTVFAFDNAGFGDSDPLPIARATMADLAMGLAEALTAMAMPPAVVFGYHSGAAVALELAVRYPALVAGLVVDGIPLFNREETDALFAGDFAPPLTIDPLGGHFSQSWTRFRDQAACYPWHDKRPERMLPLAEAAPPEKVHIWVEYFFRSAAHYAGPFRDAHDIGATAADRIRLLTIPTAFVVADDDFLVAHADRLPPLQPWQKLVRIAADPAEKQAVFDRLFDEMAGATAAPPPPPISRASDGVVRDQLTMNGRSLRVRSCGSASAPALLLLHDLPGSSGDLVAMITALGQAFRVIAPDLPGADGSDSLPGDMSIEGIVTAVDDILAAYGVSRPIAFGMGFGASFAAALAARGSASALVLAGALLPNPKLRAEMRARYAPPIAIEPDGAHWYRTWLMIRDQQFHFPWYDRRRQTQRGVMPDIDGDRLHARTVALMAQRESYAQPILAALDDDLGAILPRLSVPIARIEQAGTPLAVYDAALAALLPDSPSLPITVDALAAWASAIPD